MPAVAEDRSLGELFRGLASETRSLLHKEVELAKTEAAEKATFLGGRVGDLALGGAVALMGGLALLAAGVTGIAALFDLFMTTELAAFVAPLLLGARWRSPAGPRCRRRSRTSGAKVSLRGSRSGPCRRTRHG